MPARTRSPRHLSAFGTALLYVHRVSCRREFASSSFKRHTRLLALSPEPEALAKYRPHGMRWKEHVRRELAYSYATLTIASSVFHGRCCPHAASSLSVIGNGLLFGVRLCLTLMNTSFATCGRIPNGRSNASCCKKRVLPLRLRWRRTRSQRACRLPASRSR